MSAATRARRYRARLREGQRIYSLPLDEADAEAAVTEAGLVAPMADPTHRDVEAALTVLLARILRDRHASRRTRS